MYLALVEDARKKDPENNATLYSVSNAYEKVGDALRERGDLAGALRAYQSQKEVAERLASKANSHATWQKSLATSYQRIGLVFRMQGETAKAVEHFQKCATIPAKSTAWTPRSTWPRDVPGDCLRQLAELGAAAK
jgi:tetratricopeptide (TPR) repeat protein